MQWTETYQLVEPFLLLIATAVLTSYLAPKITQRWQDHQKELELKTNLVSEINENLMQLVGATGAAEFVAASQTREAELRGIDRASVLRRLDTAFRTWGVKKAIIGSKLRAYFPQTAIGDDWDEFSEVVTEFYALAGTFVPKYRKKRLDGLKEYIDRYFDANSVNWKTLANLELRQSNDFDERQEYHQAWDSLQNLLLKRKDALIQNILAAHISFFSS